MSKGALNRSVWPRLKKAAPKLAFGLSILSLLVLVYDEGFDQSGQLQELIDGLYIASISIGALFIVGRYFIRSRPKKWKIWLVDILLLSFLVSVLNYHSILEGLLPAFEIFKHTIWIHFSLFVIFFRELSAVDIKLKKQYLNPAQLFIASFLIIITIGTFLLLLPNASNGGLSFLDALFTSTSAVCVTGLVVVDTGSYFTTIGQTIILMLIQIGGIGIMTFTSYFSYFFRGGSSFESQLMMKDLTNSEKLGEVYSILSRIIILTLVIELIGALVIYSTIDIDVIKDPTERIFFAVFHSISGFCNAGFSTLSNSLFESGFRFNYPFQLIVAFLFVIGGMGFPIIFNFARFLKRWFYKLLPIFRKSREPIYLPAIINISSRIAIATTIVLLLVGTTLFFILEKENTLAEHEGFGKLVVAFFGGATPRTAGFNSVDMAALSFPTIMITFLLMWIGASPGSTGGGIKTSTFAVAILNFLSIARGKDRIEVFKREVSDMSIRRAFAMIALSLVVIGLAVFCVSIFDNHMRLIDIAFECVSAFSTVGLSLGITASLSAPSKMIIIITMFIGRVSMLAILSALLGKVHSLKYRYPGEDILIN